MLLHLLGNVSLAFDYNFVRHYSLVLKRETLTPYESGVHLYRPTYTIMQQLIIKR